MKALGDRGPPESEPLRQLRQLCRGDGVKGIGVAAPRDELPVVVELQAQARAKRRVGAQREQPSLTKQRHAKGTQRYCRKPAQAYCGGRREEQREAGCKEEARP